MGTIIGQILFVILGSVAELAFLLTGKWLLLLISGGRLVLMPPAPRSWFHPFKRLPNGQVGVDRELSILIALLFWSLMLALYLSSR